MSVWAPLKLPDSVGGACVPRRTRETPLSLRLAELGWLSESLGSAEALSGSVHSQAVFTAANGPREVSVSLRHPTQWTSRSMAATFCRHFPQPWLARQLLRLIGELAGRAPWRRQRLRLPTPRCSSDCQHPCPSTSRRSGLLGMPGALAGEAAAAAANYQNGLAVTAPPLAGLTMHIYEVWPAGTPK